MKTSAPATGTCRWIAKLNDRGFGVLLINGVEYHVVKVASGYNMHNLFNGKKYRLTPWDKREGTVLECDCEDARYNRQSRCDCKHSRSLTAALKRLG